MHYYIEGWGSIEQEHDFYSQYVCGSLELVNIHDCVYGRHNSLGRLLFVCNSSAKVFQQSRES